MKIMVWDIYQSPRVYRHPIKRFPYLLRAVIQMKNHLLWLRCLPWYRHGLKFMPSVPVPTWCDKWTYVQTQAPTKSRSKTPETLINTLLIRLYQERHPPDEAEFPLPPWGTEEHKVWQASWRRIISSWIQMSFRDSDIPQTTIFIT